MADVVNNQVTDSAGTTATQPGSDANAVEKKFSQAEVDQILKERLEREKAKAGEAAKSAREKAEAEAAAKNGEWQKLAEQREAEAKRYQAELREERIRLAAVRMGISDPDYAVYLVTKAGENADAEAVLKEYAGKSAPTGAKVGAVAAPMASNPTNPSAAPAVFTRSQLRDHSFFEANKAAIMQAAAEGRIRDE